MKLLKALFLLLLTASVTRAQLLVIPKVTHLSSPATPNAGAISLTVSGGTSPYSYSWTPGGFTTSSITGRAYGDYSVKVSDSGTSTATASCSIGYKVNWTEFFGTVQKQDTIQNDGSTPIGWGSASSKNTLAGGQDGWFEVVLKDLNQYKKIGFLDSISSTKTSASDIDYGFYYTVSPSRLYKIVNGVETIISSNPPEGTVLRVERVGNIIRIKVNAVTIYSVTSASDAAKMWKVKTSLLASNKGSFVNVGCSFHNQGNVLFPGFGGLLPRVQHVSNTGFNDGSLKVTPSLNGNYAYSWQPGSATSSAIGPLSLGSYSLTMTDTLNNKRKVVYNVGHRIKWGSYYGTAEKHDTLVNVGPYGWAHGISKNSIPPSTDGWFEYVLRDMDKTKTIGFLDSIYSHGSQADIDYGFYYWADANSLARVEKGVVSAFDNPLEGTVLRVERIGSTINLKVNGRVVYSTVNATDVSRRWYVKSQVLPGSTVTGAGMSVSSCSLTASAGSSQTITCANPTATLTGSSNTSGVTYSWSPGSVTTSSMQVAAAGTYTLQVTDPTSGCMARSTVSVTSTITTPLITAAIPSGSLMAHWPFDGNATDLSGNANHGVVSNAMPTFDRFGNPGRAYYFNGTTSRIDVAHSSAIDMASGNDYTMSFWIKSKPGNVDAMPISKNTYGSWNGYIFIVNSTNGGYCNGTGIFSYYVGAGAYDDACANNLISNDTTNWYFITGQYKSSTNQVFLYVNGVLQNDVGALSGTLSNTKKMSFGAYNDGAGGFYKGCLDDVRFYKRLLTQNEISALYNAPNPVTVLGCASPSITLTGFSPIAGVTYSWSPGGATTSSITVSTPGTYTLSVTDPASNCTNTSTISVTENPCVPYYFTLKKTLDAGYYNSYKNKIYFAFEEEYFDLAQGAANSLSYTIVTDKNAAVSAAPGLIEKIGDNRFVIDLSTVSGLNSGEFYRIAITNKKNEVFYARFKY